MPEKMQYSSYQRPGKGLRLDCALKTNSLPDAMPPGKTPVAQNVRSYKRGTVVTRPGSMLAFTAADTITDMRDYVRLSTNEATRILSRGMHDRIYLDGTFVGSMATSTSGGAIMLPFRPSASPNPFIYVTNGADYQKFSAPDGSGTVTQSKVGIAEPQSAPDAIIAAPYLNLKSVTDGTWSAAGTAGAGVNGSRITDTIQVGILPDPAVSSQPQLYSFGVTAGKNYQPGAYVSVTHGMSGSAGRIEAVFPAIPTGTIQSIQYYSGSVGHCVVVPNLLSTQNAPGAAPSASSVFDPLLLASLGRGALVQLGSELCYVWSVTRGPNGVLSFETSTVSSHVAGETVTGVAAVSMYLANNLPYTAGDGISVDDWTSSVGAGTGTLTSTTNIGLLFSNSAVGSAQPDDYLHLSLYLSSAANLTEGQLQIDVGDGTFQSNYYYVAVRPNDLTPIFGGGQSQLTAAQVIAQRAAIEAGQQQMATQNLLSKLGNGADSFVGVDEALNTASTFSSLQLAAQPAGVWTELWIPLRVFTRVGNDHSLSLLNASSIRLSVTVTGTTSVAISSLWVGANGFQPDVGPQGSPYYYRVRPRSKVTGTRGNPSPATRYGANPRRQAVTVVLPSAAYDSQIDTWDVFRYGGTLTSWRYVGSANSSSSTFTDNFYDTDALGGESLDFDNYEPWPTVGLPLNDTASVVCGTLAVIPATYGTDLYRMLPGTLVQLAGNQVFTLRKRPVNLPVGGVLLEFVESAGPGTNVSVSIPEPALARQVLPYVWGPDARGTVFGCGDPLRPGTLYMAKPYFPDSAPEYATLELCAPSEPLLGGEVIDGVSVGFSSRRAWRLYPGGSWQAQISGLTANVIGGYTPVEYPVGRGFAAPYAHCANGKDIFFVGPDGVYMTTTGAAVSLTDADLSNLFPHEGVGGGISPGIDFTYGGYTIPAPYYAASQTFRLAWANDYLFFDYQGSDGLYHSLVCELRRGQGGVDPHWMLDTFPQATTCHLYPAQPENSANAQNQVYRADTAGATYYEAGTTDNGTAIPWALATCEFTDDDERANKVWGDIYVDVIPQSAVSCQPMYEGAAVAGVAATVIPAGSSRVQTTVSVGGEVLLSFLGLLLSGSHSAALPTELNLWQPAWLPQPESTADRVTDWDDSGLPAAKFVQGFVLNADTFGANKSVLVRNGDTGGSAQTFTVNHSGQQEKAYSFSTPFIAHLVRLEPQDATVPWRLFGVRWVFQPTPETVTTWQTQRTAHGLEGYMHVRQLSVSYAATAPVTLTITAFDGTSPATITLPSTGGVVEKVLVVPTFNKGLIYSYGFSSAQNFQIYQDDCEVLVGAWQRQSPYTNYPLVGGRRGDQAPI